MALEPGRKSSEFLFLVFVGVVALAVATGWLTPAKMQGAAKQIQQTTETVPELIASVKDLVTSLAPLAGLMGLAWAYLKRRSGLKNKEISGEYAGLQAEKEVERIEALRRLEKWKQARGTK